MAAFNQENFEILEDNIKFVAEELQAFKNTLETDDGQGLARERRLLADEIRSSQNINAQAAEHLLRIEDGIKSANAAFEAQVQSTGEELRKKERSAQASTQLLQTRQADVEQQLANVTEQLQELTSLVGQVDSNRKRNEQILDQMEGRLKQLLEDGQFRKELREIAAKEAGNANEALVMVVAQKAIRQGIESGLLAPGPKALQPKPDRPAGSGD